MAELEPRYYYYGGRRYGYSRWHGWGRWVLLGVILAVALLVFILFACISARKRRKAGRKPFMGTGWAAAGRNNQQQQQQPMAYNPGQYESNAGYQQKPGGGAAQDYYSPQYNQPPAYGSQTVQPGTYQPPTAPPPAANPSGWR